MKIPPMILLTNLRLNDAQPSSPIAVRVDTVILVERASIKLEEQPAAGVRVAKVPERKEAREGTILHLMGGGRLFVEESVEEVAGALRKADRWWFW